MCDVAAPAFAGGAGAIIQALENAARDRDVHALNSFIQDCRIDISDRPNPVGKLWIGLMIGDAGRRRNGGAGVDGRFNPQLNGFLGVLDCLINPFVRC